MDYNELSQRVNVLEKEIKEIEHSVEAKICRRNKRIRDLNLRYIDEHQPLALKQFQRIKVVARVTEESRKALSEEARRMKKYALGTTYTIVGVFNWYNISVRGRVVPCFYGDTRYRGMYDEVLSVELTASQPEGSCHKCRCAKDGRCYLLGGKSLGPICAIRKIDEDKMVPCPHYEEVVEGGLYGIRGRVWPARYYPRVTMVRTEDGERKYRLYEGDWACYTEWDEQHIANGYTREPQDYGEDTCRMDCERVRPEE